MITILVADLRGCTSMILNAFPGHVAAVINGIFRWRRVFLRCILRGDGLV